MGKGAAERIGPLQDRTVPPGSAHQQEHHGQTRIALLHVDLALERLQVLEDGLGLDAHGSREAGEHEVDCTAVPIGWEWPFASAADCRRHSGLEVGQ